MAYMKKTFFLFNLTFFYFLLFLTSFSHAISTEGLIAYWSFDEGSGTSLSDSSGSGNTGTLNNMDAADWVSGRLGKALDFDGTNDYVSYAAPAGFDYPFTLAAWAKPDTLSQNGIIMSIGTENHASAFGLYSDGDALFVDRPPNGRGLSGISNYLTAGKWQHWVVIFDDANTVRFYLDGQEKILTDLDDRYDPNENNIGARSNGTERQFNGAIDEVRIYNRALTDTEVRQLYTATSTIINAPQTEFLREGLILMQSFDGAYLDWSNASAEARDASNFTNHGNIIGTTSTRGKVGQALYFDGISDQINIPHSESLAITDAYTYTSWVRIDDVLGGSNMHAFISKRGNMFTIDQTNAGGNVVGGKVKLSVSHNGTTYFSGWDFPYQEIFFLSVTWDGSSIILYCNGEIFETFSDVTDLLDTATDDLIISYGQNQYGWTGRLEGMQDEVRLYNRALSQEEVRQLYSLGGGGAQGAGAVTLGFSQTDLVTDGLILYHSFDGAYMDWANATAEARDASSNGLHGDAVRDVRTVRGKVGQALDFDGIDDYVNVEDPVSGSLDFDAASSFTISLWIKMADSVDSFALSKRNLAAGYEMIMGRGATIGRLGMRVADGVGDGLIYSNNWDGNNDGAWHHLVGVIDRTLQEMRIYGDGVMIGAPTNIATLGSLENDINLAIGARGPGNSPAQAAIDEVRLYDRVLSTDEIEQLYSLGRGNDE